MSQDPTTDSPHGSPGIRPDLPPVAPQDKTVISKRSVGPRAAPIVSRASLEAGRNLEGIQLGHFRLEKYVGGGGMGSVYRATDLTLARTVAVKVVSLADADEDTLRRFRNEAQSAARLDHPNIARVYFVDEDQGWSYIVFEFIEGINIRDLVDSHGPLQLDEAVSFLLDLADALDHASQRDVVHRDIKPSNILITPQGRAKLVDMGLARLHQVETVSNDLTAPGVTLGTFDYISPEQARDPRSADVRSDIYSLGCTLYFMLTGLPPFPDGTVLQKLLSHSSEPPPDPRAQRGDLPPEVSALLVKMLAKLPAQRFQTARELTTALHAIAQKYDLLIARTAPTAWDTPNRAPESAPRKQLFWIVPSFLLLCSILAIELLSPGAPSISRDSVLARQPKTTTSASVGSASVIEPANSVSQQPFMLDEIESAIEEPGDPSPTISVPASPLRTAEPSRSADATVSRASDDSSTSEDLETPTKRAIRDSSPKDSSVPSSDAPNVPSAPADIQANTSESSREDIGVSRADRRTVVTEVPPDPDVIHRLVVGEADNSHDSATRFVPSFAAAIHELPGWPEVETIETGTNEVIDELLVIRHKRPLVIRAVQGSQPALVFRPRSSAYADKRSMVRLLGGEIVFEGLNWRLELPPGTTDGWSMFQLEVVNRIRLQACTLTIDSSPAQRDTAFFSVLGSRLTMMMPHSASLSMPSSPRVELHNCLARGNATFIRAMDGVPFLLNWKQGMFLTTERFSVVQGSREPATIGRVEVDLQSLIVRADRGFAEMEVTESAPNMHASVFDVTNCVIMHDSSQPLYRHTGVESIEFARQSFKVLGKENSYPQTEVFWSVQAVSESKDFSLVSRTGEAWCLERPSNRSLRWERRREDNLVQEHLPTDYLVSDVDRETFGFDFTQLPKPPNKLDLVFDSK